MGIKQGLSLSLSIRLTLSLTPEVFSLRLCLYWKLVCVRTHTRMLSVYVCVSLRLCALNTLGSSVCLKTAQRFSVDATFSCRLFRPIQTLGLARLDDLIRSSHSPNSKQTGPHLA